MRCVISLLSTPVKLYAHTLCIHGVNNAIFSTAIRSSSINFHPNVHPLRALVCRSSLQWSDTLAGPTSGWTMMGAGKASCVLGNELPATRLMVAASFLPCFNGKSNKVRVFFCCSLSWCAAQQGPIPQCCSRPAGPAVPTWTFVSHSGHINLAETLYFTPLLPWNHVDMFQKYKLVAFLPFLSPSESKLNEKGGGDGWHLKKKHLIEQNDFVHGWLPVQLY